ncbi:Smr/MutS family protein [Marinobacterium rhizophilum]|uniref:Smr/MutS family protein n=1 Tax=Marinobacterium rhizophilum TaxID=420402 RepID=UPI00036EF511|nr:Smr/MutS family protein [Marinobacterium rhizophilum]
MSDHKLPADDAAISFENLMQDVDRHRHDRADVGPRVSDRQNLDYKRAAATRETRQVIDGLSSEAAEIVESCEELLFAAPGIQLGLMKRLRKGHIPWEQGLDLHGMTVDQARDELCRFIADGLRQQARVVLVVHGKAYSQAGSYPVLKSRVNDWLRQLHGVMAFCSAQPKDGGTGALYVLLKRKSGKSGLP